jgi:hypothetical protein
MSPTDERRLCCLLDLIYNGDPWSFSSEEDLEELTTRCGKAIDSGDDDTRNYEIRQLCLEITVLYEKLRLGDRTPVCTFCHFFTGEECSALVVSVKKDTVCLERCPLKVPIPD